MERLLGRCSITRGRRIKRATRAGERRDYIRKIAHLRQTGVETFNIVGPADLDGDLAGDLQSILQHVYDGVSFKINSGLTLLSP